MQNAEKALKRTRSKINTDKHNSYESYMKRIIFQCACIQILTYNMARIQISIACMTSMQSLVLITLL